LSSLRAATLSCRGAQEHNTSGIKISAGLNM
jgi:hypothetical protein